MTDSKQPLIDLNESVLTTVQFKVNDQALFREIETEAVLLHITNGSYYSLNETSLPFWEALRDQQPLIGAIEQITDEYAVERKQVLADLQVFLETLLQYDLIETQQ